MVMKEIGNTVGDSGRRNRRLELFHVNQISLRVTAETNKICVLQTNILNQRLISRIG